MHRDDLLWLAGLLEGEGSFMKGPPSRPHIPAISISMTDEDVIERVGQLLQAKPTVSKRGANRGWKPAYIVCLRGSRALELMKELRPLMGRRRQSQIDAAVASYRRKPNPTYKLTQGEVLVIRRRADAGEELRVIAKDYGVDHSLVWRIKKRIIHKNLGLSDGFGGLPCKEISREFDSPQLHQS